MIVTLDGSLGNGLDQRTAHLTDLGEVQPAIGFEAESVAGESKRLPMILTRFEPQTAHFAACAFPGLHESKKLRQARRESLTDCTNATLGTSHNHARSLGGLGHGDDPALNLAVRQFHPGPYASSRTRSASLNTTRQHPNTRPSICLLGRCRFDAVPVTHLHDPTVRHDL